MPTATRPHLRGDEAHTRGCDIQALEDQMALIAVDATDYWVLPIKLDSDFPQMGIEIEQIA